MAVRRNLFRSLIATTLIAILFLAIGYSLFRSNPGWYRAIALTDEEQIAGQNRLIDRLATLRNDVGHAQADVEDRRQAEWPTFDVEISEADVDGFLMRWANTDPQVKAALHGLEEPHVRFLDDRIALAGRSTDTGSLLSIELTVTQTAEGPLVSLGRPWAGRMPLSRSLVEDPATAAIASLRKGDRGKIPDAVIDCAAKFITGEPTAPVIVIQSSLNSLVETRVEKLTIADGVLKATLRPVGAKR